MFNIQQSILNAQSVELFNLKWKMKNWLSIRISNKEQGNLNKEQKIIERGTRNFE